MGDGAFGVGISGALLGEAPGAGMATAGAEPSDGRSAGWGDAAGARAAVLAEVGFGRARGRGTRDALPAVFVAAGFAAGLAAAFAFGLAAGFAVVLAVFFAAGFAGAA